MSDVFISYARSTEGQALRVAEALRVLGYRVWRDDEIPAHRAYADVIEERLKAAKAVVVVWSAEAARSEWVRSEAESARADHKLIQLSVDGAKLPMPFDQIECADLAGWTGDTEAHDWRKVVASVADLTSGAAPAPVLPTAPTPTPARSICVLPFANMSGDPEQEYFSDGISEDIITDLSKVSSLFVAARTTAFALKGKTLDARQVAHQLGVRHVLTGSVRKAVSRVRITAQLIDSVSGGQVWAERYDRDLNDIFALQDEISQAIVAALKLKLAPEEKQAIEQRGTTNPEAYNLYLMARGYYMAGHDGEVRGLEATVRLCTRAAELDPAYAQAWALLAIVQTALHSIHNWPGDSGLAAAERALTLDPSLASAHAAKARHLWIQGRADEARAEAQTALSLDPESWEANTEAARIAYLEHRFDDAIRDFEKATALLDTPPGDPGMLVSCYRAVGDQEGMKRAARIALARCERALAQDQRNGTALAFGVNALAALGDVGRARDWIYRALLVDPDNVTMRYNFACTASAQLRDADTALEVLGPAFEKVTRSNLDFSKADPDLDFIRDDPRFKAMVAAAEARLAATDGAA